MGREIKSRSTVCLKPPPQKRLRCQEQRLMLYSLLTSSLSAALTCDVLIGQPSTSVLSTPSAHRLPPSRIRERVIFLFVFCFFCVFFWGGAGGDKERKGRYIYIVRHCLFFCLFLIFTTLNIQITMARYIYIQ